MMHQEHIVFGIDLGTTYSCIAYVDKYGQPVIIPDEDNNHTVPSVVLFEGNKRIVGREAKNSALLNPGHVIQMIKREMGNRLYRFPWNGEGYTPQEISSYILRKLANQAEKNLGYPVRDVVITCPAYFGIAQREATALAGKLAGLNVLEIINEPSAAAIMYGAHKLEKNQVVLIFDLGGGTFDVTVIKIAGGAITVIATGGDHHLGGYEWDEMIVRYLAEQWKETAHSLDDPRESEETAQEIFNKVEDAKHDLTKLDSKKVFFSHAGQRVSVNLTRKKFDDLTEPLRQSTIQFTEMTLWEAKKRGVDQIDRILLVGGATKMPQIAERLEELYHIKPELYQPDEAVAKGAAIYGQKLYLDEAIRLTSLEETGIEYKGLDIADLPTGTRNTIYQNVAMRIGVELELLQRFHGLQIRNVASHSFGVVALDNTGHPGIDNLVLANQGLPATVSKDDYRRPGNASRIEVKIIENNNIVPRVDDVKLINQGAEIGCFYLSLPPDLPDNTPLNVTFELNKQGRLRVTVRELINGNQIDEEIETNVTLSDAELTAIEQRMPHLVIL